jgi:hypothetical protein
MSTTLILENPRRPRKNSSGSFGFSLKQIVTGCVLSALIAGTLSVLTTESLTGIGPAPGNSVVRKNKVDRLRTTPNVTLPRSDSNRLVPRIEGIIPIGCERAFSPIVSPLNADVVRHCLA